MRVIVRPTYFWYTEAILFFMNFFAIVETALAQTAATTPSTTSKVAEVGSDLLDTALKIFVVIVVFIVALLVARLIVYRVIESVRKNHSEEEHKEMLVLASRLIYITFAVTGIAIGLGVTDMFGGLGWLFGAVGLGIGFSLQNIIGNFVAGITLLMQRKMKIGDYVEINQYKGVITNIGSRTTTLHDFDGTDVLVPNLEFFNKYVRIYTANTYRRIYVEIGVGYDTDFPKAYEKIFEILKRYPDVEQEPPPDILCDQIKDSTVNIMIRWWIRSNFGWWTLQSNVLRDVFVELQSIGVDISFPVQTLRVDAHESDALYSFLQKQPGAASASAQSPSQSSGQ